MSALIRWMIRRDLPRVLEIEQRAFRSGWTEETFIDVLRSRNTTGMVCEVRHEIRGFMVYHLQKSTITILNFAVCDAFRRRGTGRQMVDRLKDKLCQQRRRILSLKVRESNLGAQLFFQKCGFKAIQVLRGEYEDTDEDAYLLRFELDAEPGYVPVNRISDFVNE